MSWNIINIKLFAFILILSSSISRAQNCEKRVEEIFNDIIEGIGNNSIYPPTIEFSNDSLSVASMGDYTVTVERKVIDLFCGEEKFDDKIAYILGHELAHHYLNHTWMANTGLGYSNSLGNFIEDKMYSRDQRKLAESEADLFAGFYGMVSGYNALANAKETQPNQSSPAYALRACQIERKHCGSCPQLSVSDTFLPASPRRLSLGTTS